MPLQATSGAASYDAFGGGVAAVPNYIEEVFSTYLYTGNGSTQTITNGIDLSTKGGLVWAKARSSADNHGLYDTARGVENRLISNSTAAQSTASGVTAFNANGFSLGSNSDVNGSGKTTVSWTFRKQPKFFDVVTWTGNSTSGRQIAHNLNGAIGTIIVKNLTNADEWLVWHRSLGDFGGAGKNLVLNSTAAVDTGGYFGTAANQTSTYFTVNADTTKINWSGNNYVAYLFAHDAGGFGLTGTDNVISCGSYTGNGSATGPVVTLGYEPQWLLIKQTNAARSWVMYDNMRGIATGGNDAGLYANSSDAEFTNENNISLSATGFQLTSTSTDSNANAGTYIYIAIRRGPMKVPTSGTSVLGLNARTGTGANATVTGLAPTDLIISKRRQNAGFPPWGTRLLGFTYLSSSNGNAETSGASMYQNPPFDVQNGVKIATASNINSNGETYINYLFGRAPSFMDVVCYTGTGSALSVTHNLGVAPELIITKRRNSATDWYVYCQYVSSYNTAYTQLNATNQFFTNGAIAWNATSTTYNASTFLGLSTSGGTYVSYLFSTCAGVSKVGSYTGTGTTLQVNCGFTSGARFVLIKRTDLAGDWYVWDSARGIVSGNDPYLLLNSTAAEVTNTDYVDTYSAGFEISSTAPAAINASGGSFIFFAVA